MYSGCQSLCVKGLKETRRGSCITIQPFVCFDLSVEGILKLAYSLIGQSGPKRDVNRALVHPILRSTCA